MFGSTWGKALILTKIIGIVLMVVWNLLKPAYFRKEVVPGSDVEVP